MKYTPTYQHFKNTYNKTVLILYSSMFASICFAGMLNQTKPKLKMHHILFDYAHQYLHFSSNKQFIKTSTAKIIEFFSITIPKYENLKVLKEKHILVQYSVLIIHFMNILTK